MKQGWRWYGDADAITLKEIRQAGVTDIVAALVCIATAMLAMKTKIPMTLVILLGAAASLCWRLFV